MIELTNIHKTYGSGAQTAVALQGIDLHVERGDVLGLIGPSGAGKSTLLRCINLLERPTSGTVRVDGQLLTGLSDTALRGMRRRVGIIFQHFNLLASATVYDNAALPLRLAGAARDAVQRVVSPLLERLGLWDHRHKYPSQLSGGQKQRVGIARALSTQPVVLLCDEATSALDPVSTQDILALLREIHRDMGLTLVVVTHEMSAVRALCNRVAVVDHGRVVEQGKLSDVFFTPRQPITRELVRQTQESCADEVRARYANLPSHERAQCTLLQLSALGNSAADSILCDLAQRPGIHFNILSGTMSSLQGTAFGELLMELHAAAPVLADTLAWLQARPGVRIEKLA